MARDVYATAAWLAVRKRVLERDGRKCQIGLPGCRGWADGVDHVTELWEDGEKYDPANLVAACRPCNSKKHVRVMARRAGPRVRAW